MKRSLVCPAALLAAACCWSACAASPAAPSDGTTGPLRLSAAGDQAMIAPGGDATIVFTLENRGAVDVQLTFPGGCQILSYIRSQDSLIYPSGGGWACPAIIAMVTLRAGASITSELRVRAAASADHAVVPLPPGDYTAYATVDATDHHLTSPPVAFSVR